MVYWFSLVVQLLLVLRIAVGFNISKPNCVDHCGDVMIPYPFGIGSDCYYNRSYEIVCNSSFGSSKPFLRQINLEVLDIAGSFYPGAIADFQGVSDVLLVRLPRQNFCESTGSKKSISYDLKGSSYLFAMDLNALMMEGCQSRAVLKNQNGETLASCDSICASGDPNMSSGITRNGYGFCTASISPDILTKGGDLDYLEIHVVFQQQANFNSCNSSVAFSPNDYSLTRSGVSSLATFPTALRWRSSSSLELCDGGVLKPDLEGVYCTCPEFYEGNPYLPNGCQGSKFGIKV